VDLVPILHEAEVAWQPLLAQDPQLGPDHLAGRLLLWRGGV
jgi:hypothetical protein